MASAAVVAPLALSTVKRRYPRLFQEFTLLSDREKDGTSDFGNDDDSDFFSSYARPVIDPATGLCTRISLTDFTQPLEDNGDDCAMATSSDANKFNIFLWQCLIASETGSSSIGGDACRQYDLLNRALDDVLSLAMATTTTAASVATAKFEHLLGWTAAATNHGLHALLYRGDPDRNRTLFKAVGDEWKEAFEKTTACNNNNGSNDKAGIVSEALRKFAIWMCESFQKLLKDAKKEYGDHAKYSFNFIKQTARRVPKGPASVATAAALPKNNSATATAAAATAAQLLCTNEVTTVVIKPMKDFKLGLGIGQKGGNSAILVNSIAPGSLFLKTGLKVGMTLKSINGKKYRSFAEGLALIKGAEGKLTIVATTVTPIPPPPADTAVRSAAAPSAATASTNVIVSSNQRQQNLILSTNSISEADDDEPKPWELDGWVPQRGGKQATPDMIRKELQKYIDQCKADGTMNQSRIITKMGVNNNTFRRFMNPKTYKEQWSATQNGTYWAAARLLAKVKYENEKAKKSEGTAKRKPASSSSSDDESSTKKVKAILPVS
ncbi:hypothetical protein ACHAXR_013111 [Thalassiosira sp. AJA248-18]